MAFDNVRHDVLAQDLLSHNVSGCVLAWIGDYLTDRSQRLLFYGNESQFVPVQKGIPQGCVLGPTLFNKTFLTFPV